MEFLCEEACIRLGCVTALHGQSRLGAAMVKEFNKDFIWAGVLLASCSLVWDLCKVVGEGFGNWSLNEK